MPGHFGRLIRPVCALCSALGSLLLGAVVLQAQQPSATPPSWPAPAQATPSSATQPPAKQPQTAQPQAIQPRPTQTPSGSPDMPRAAFSQGFRPLAPVSEYYPTEEQKARSAGTPIPQTISASPAPAPRTTAHAPAAPEQTSVVNSAQTEAAGVPGKGTSGEAKIETPAAPAQTAPTQTAASSAAALPLSRPGNGEADKDSERGRIGSTSSQLGMTVVALTAVLLLIAVLVKVLKKHTPLAGQSLPDDVLSLLGRKMIDQRNAVQFLRLGDRILVVGISVDGLRTLAEITDPVEVDRIAGACHTPAVESTMSRSFRFLLSRQNENDPETASAVTKTKPARKKRFSMPSAPAGFSWETPDVSKGSAISQDDIAELTRTLQEAREANG